jgi:hypothetical protein
VDLHLESAMAQKFRTLRCPNCRFEHLVRGPEVREKNGTVYTPWKCLRCGCSGEVFEGRRLTWRPPPDGADAWQKNTPREN